VGRERRFSADTEERALRVRGRRQTCLVDEACGTVQLVRDDDPRDVLQTLEQFAKELLGGTFIAPGLHQNAEHLAVLVNRTP